MILVDTSIWADHLVRTDETLFELLQNSAVVMHPFVVGEVALGNLPRRAVVLAILQGVPTVEVASTTEVLRLIERYELAGSGVGYVDTHLVASAMLTPPCKLWTRDRRLAAVTVRLGIAADFA